MAPESGVHYYHRPVLVNEVVALLEPKPGGAFVDATVGGGGHAAEILDRTSPDGVLIGIDRDPDAIAFAADVLRPFGNRVKLVRGNYRDIGSIVPQAGLSQVDGVLFDLGISSHQLESGRGFSFSGDEPLDMRMDPDEPIPTAADIVNRFGESELAKIIRSYGEERYARLIARAIVERRAKCPIATSAELAETVLQAVGRFYRGQKIHAATRTFQSLRIAVNSELDALKAGLQSAIELLKPGGRVCVISFHSLEDRIVKTLFRQLEGRCECDPKLPECVCGARKLVRVLTRTPVRPSENEKHENPRSRSAKLRCAVKLSEEPDPESAS